MIFNFIFSNVQLVNVFSQTLIAYLTVYIYGLASVGVFISMLRAIAEHKILDSNIKKFWKRSIEKFEK